MVMNGWLHITCSERSRSCCWTFLEQSVLYVEKHPPHRLYVVMFFPMYLIKWSTSLISVVPGEMCLSGLVFQHFDSCSICQNIFAHVDDL